MIARLLSSVVLVFGLLATPSWANEDPAPLNIVASFSILGDMVKQVAGENANVTVLVGPNEDPHHYTPTPEAAKAVAQADIIVMNGLMFENGMDKLIKNAGTKAKLLIASAGVKPRKLKESGAQSQQSLIDPHAWQDLRNGQRYIKNIAEGLAAARPALASYFMARARDQIAQMFALDEWARQAFAKLPAERRQVITSHDAFGYLGDAYDVHFYAPNGSSGDQGASAATMATLIEQIKEQQIHTIFIENMTDPRLTQQIAKDTGARIGGTLYPDALTSADGEAPTYLDMMLVNIRRLADK